MGVCKVTAGLPAGKHKVPGLKSLGFAVILPGAPDQYTQSIATPEALYKATHPSTFAITKLLA